jgi:hypothetical protein
MKSSKLENFMKIHRETEDALYSNVKISHSEVLKLVLTDLIAKRNSPNNKIKEHFDEVLRYYITEDEFIKFVIKGNDIS